MDQLAPTLGLPATPGTWALAAALAGSPETVARQARDFTALIEEGGGSALPLAVGQTGPAWHRIRNLCTTQANPARILCRITVPIGRTGERWPPPGSAARLAACAPPRGGPRRQRRGLGPVPARHGRRPGRAGGPRAGGAAPARPQAAEGSLVLQEAPPPLKRQAGRLGLARSGLEHDAAAQS